MLYEALTGRLPFRARRSRSSRASRRATRTAADVLATGIPPDLDQLCEALLRREPTRPAVEAGGRPCASGPSPAAPDRREAAPPSTVRRPRARLTRSCAPPSIAGQGGRSRVLRARPSGMGKTALVRRFSTSCARRSRWSCSRAAATSASRCRTRPSTAIVDGLSHHLRSLPSAEVARTAAAPTPRRWRALFPVLQRVRRLADARRSELADSRRSTELRARGVRARCASSWHAGPTASRWCSSSTICNGATWTAPACIGEIVAAPAPPNLLWIGAYRSEDSDTSPLLRRAPLLEEADARGLVAHRAARRRADAGVSRAAWPSCSWATIPTPRRAPRRLPPRRTAARSSSPSWLTECAPLPGRRPRRTRMPPAAARQPRPGHPGARGPAPR